MKLRITKTTIMEDQSRPDPGSAHERELVAWKRVIARGHAEADAQTTRFETILDMRAGILTTRRIEGAISAARIAHVLAGRMAEETALPTSRVFVERSASEERAEWIALDPTHASGLLHRVKEVDAEERPIRPWPPQMNETLGLLFACVRRNVGIMRQIHERILVDRAPPAEFLLDTAEWEALRGPFLEMVDSAPLRVATVRFFERARRYDQLVRAIMTAQMAWERPSGDVSDFHDLARHAAREEILGGLHDDAVALGESILREWGATPRP